LHQHDELQLSQTQQELLKKQTPSELFPEFYLIKVNQFDDIARDSLDEWIYFLKNEEVKDNFKAKGLQQAKETLDLMKLSDEERAAYEAHIEERRYQSSMYFSSFYEGKQEGIELSRKATALAMKQDGEPLEKIARYTQLSAEIIKQL
jgi:hypothetical protein